MNYSDLTGKVVTCTDEEYNVLRLEYNLAIDRYPLALVYCFNNEDVSNAIKWCRKNDVALRIRGHGHNYEGYSVGNGVLVIDTSYMNNIKVNTLENTVEIQAGAKLEDVYSELARYGYGFPGGTCPTVGISGLVSGGGIGLSMRRYGLTADSLIALQMINASGNLITAHEERHEDLFWACRGGGGGNFGVIVSYIFKVHKVKKVTLIQLRWSAEARVEFLDLWQRFFKTADERISCFAGFDDKEIYLNGFFYGTEEEANRIMKDFLLLPGLTSTSSIKLVSFIEAVKAIGDQYGPPGRFSTTGRFVYKMLSKDTIKQLVRLVDNSPSENSGRISLYSMGGAIKERSSKQTAFYYRNASYIMAIGAGWNKDQDAEVYRNWVAIGYRFIKNFTRGSYVNFSYRNQKHYQFQYYGDNKYRLIMIKRKYDPQNIFNFPQSIS